MDNQLQLQIDRLNKLIGIQEYRNTGIQEYRNTGIQEYRNTGIQEYRNTGIIKSNIKVKITNKVIYI
jgi:hypothetical protein